MKGSAAAAQRKPGKRRRGRQMALQMLYQLDMGGSSLPEILTAFDPSQMTESSDEADAPRRADDPVSEEALAYARRLVEGTVGRRDEIDDVITRQADNWRLERMSAVDRNVLRLAVYELTREPDVPKLVVVDEAIELAKTFGSDQSGRFVNGILDGFLRADDRPTTKRPKSGKGAAG